MLLSEFERGEFVKDEGVSENVTALAFDERTGLLVVGSPVAVYRRKEGDKWRFEWMSGVLRLCLCVMWW